jgi:hypothetical protein
MSLPNPGDVKKDCHSPKLSQFHPGMLFFPMNAGDRAGVHGFLNKICGPAGGLNDLRLFVALLHLEDLGADFDAGSTTDTFLFIEIDSLAHILSSNSN